MNDTPSSILAVSLFSEILTNEQLVRNRLGRVLPKGMEISHFSVLNYLARIGEERSPAQLAKTFYVTRGAMTNTLSKLEWSGWRPSTPAVKLVATVCTAGSCHGASSLA